MKQHSIKQHSMRKGTSSSDSVIITVVRKQVREEKEYWNEEGRSEVGSNEAAQESGANRRIGERRKELARMHQRVKIPHVRMDISIRFNNQNHMKSDAVSDQRRKLNTNHNLPRDTAEHSQHQSCCTM